VIEGAKERDRRTVVRISCRPSAWLALLLWALIVAIGEVLIIPNQIDWFDLTHLSSLNGERVLDALGGPILVLAMLAFATVGAAIATLRPKNGVGWLCLASSLICVLTSVLPGADTFGVPWRVLEPTSSVAYNLLVPPLPVTLMLLIFPEGRLPSRRWWAVVAVASAGYGLTFLGMWNDIKNVQEERK
jgi:hypothetical protein